MQKLTLRTPEKEDGECPDEEEFKNTLSECDEADFSGATEGDR